MTRLGWEGVRAYRCMYAPGSPDVRENWPSKIGLVLEGVRGRTGAYGGVRGRTGFLGILGIVSSIRGRTGRTGVYRLSGHSIQY